MINLELKEPSVIDVLYAEVTLFVPPDIGEIIEQYNLRVPPGVHLMVMAYRPMAWPFAVAS